MRNRNNISKQSKGHAAVLCLYLMSLLSMPLFHFHPDADHHDVDGNNFHSHLLPPHADNSHADPTAEHQEVLQDFFLEPHHRLYSFYTISNLENRVIDEIASNQLFHHPIISDFSFSQRSCIPVEENRSNITRAIQQDNFVLFSANTSPPIA